MDWKEFFKPSIAKVVVTSVLFIISVPFIKYYNGLTCEMAPCPNESVGTILQYIYHYARYGIQYLRYFNFSAIREINFLVLVAGLILSYLISCFFVTILNNGIKNNKKFFSSVSKR